MLEILVLVWLCTSLGKVLRGKGRKPLVFQILLVISWFVGETIGFFSYGVFQAIRGGGQQDMGLDLMLYLSGWGAAACTAGFWFFIAHALPDTRSYAPQSFEQQVGPPPRYEPPNDPNNPYAPPRMGE